MGNLYSEDSYFEDLRLGGIKPKRTRKKKKVVVDGDENIETESSFMFQDSNMFPSNR
jgi:hypothetical protein